MLGDHKLVKKELCDALMLGHTTPAWTTFSLTFIPNERIPSSDTQLIQLDAEIR